MLSIPQINIITVVDVVGALSDNTLYKNIYMMDNSRGLTTQHQGTEKLRSAVRHGQVINWHSWPIDVQTDVKIQNIVWYDRFEPCVKLKEYSAPGIDSYWAGIVKLSNELNETEQPPTQETERIASGCYYYQLTLKMGDRVMTAMAGANIEVIKESEWRMA